jgi:hypothetical protein
LNAIAGSTLDFWFWRQKATRGMCGSIMQRINKNFNRQ